ncbi:unnamed protein product [Rotaria sp. Silwood2]|nr:unnamed protein product [Rotaria sp. Silwood2]CAF3152664.1 unnamed protein product [Rotaria sp. Silwood2]CAF3375789.1 unnamed protein product [Rotaria sp. Silwood2]CAF3497389.1 unnamed protein product [Rotaria sp. Silwood2]CAF4242641.1 unnamed protein product [Rotaria sp. Silwood2]
MKLEKHSLLDKGKIRFHQSLTTNHFRSTPLLSIIVVEPVNTSVVFSLDQNWTSQKVKPNVRFNDKQKKFLQEKFDEGIKTGMKWDSARVSLDMEMLTSNGGYVFNSDECLTQGQIKSYFSRLSLKQQSTEPIVGQQTASIIASFSLSFTGSTDTKNIKSNDMSNIDESDDSEQIYDRELEVYLWRHVLDGTRNILDGLSISFASSPLSPTSDSASIANDSSKIKSAMDN